MTVTILLLLGLIVGTAGAINSAYPVKMVELGQNIPHAEAYNLDPYNIVPADTFAICHFSDATLINCIGRRLDDPDGSYFRYFGAQFDTHFPAASGDYYAIPFSSSYVIGNKSLDLARIRSEPEFRDTHLKLYTVLPDPTPVPTATPEPTTIPTTEPTVNYSATLAAIESKVTEHDTQIAEIQETLAPPSTSTPEPTQSMQMMAAPTISPVPTATIDYDATIAALDKRIAAAEEQARKQDDLIYQIMKFLGLAE
jgi:hypothetical protein